MSFAASIRENLSVLRAVSRNLKNHKQEPEAPFLPLVLQPDDVCLHIGATDGRHSYTMASALTGSGHIYAFEPSPITFPVLKKVIALHRLNEKMSIFQKAVSNSSGKLTLNVPIKRSGRIGNAYGFTSAAATDGRNDVKSTDILHFDVEATTIDEIVGKMAGRVDFIRMDIEGSEMLALEGGWKSIDAYKPHLLIEIHPNLLESQFGTKPQAIFEAFKQRGYEIYHLDNDVLVKSENLDIKPWKDYFFMHPSRPHNLPLSR